MSTAANSDPRIVSLKVAVDAIIADVDDGRIVSVPLAWSWRLSNAALAQRRRFEIIASGEGVHWPDIDEDIRARGMLQGVPARPPKQRNAKRRGA